MTTVDTVVTPQRIMELASGFMAAKHLFAANELGLFEALADGPTALSGLAARTGLTERAARISADAMVALGLLEKDGPAYRNTPVAETFLSGGPGPDLRPFLRFWDQISYPVWNDLARALAEGPPQEIFELDDERQAVVSAGIEAVLTGPAQALATSDLLAGRARLLDVGGGTGSWTIAACRAHPPLRATVVDLPVVAAIAGERIAQVGLGDRIDSLALDVRRDPLPRGYDAVLVGNLVHYWSPDGNRELLRRIRAAVEPGALLLIADFWTDPTHTQPLHAALMAGEFAVHLAEGDVYSVEDLRSWLDADWTFVEHRALAGPQSVAVLRAS